MILNHVYLKWSNTLKSNIRFNGYKAVKNKKEIFRLLEVYEVIYFCQIFTNFTLVYKFNNNNKQYKLI